VHYFYPESFSSIFLFKVNIVTLCAVLERNNFNNYPKEMKKINFEHGRSSRVNKNYIKLTLLLKIIR
jgi:hypothetical protein